MTKWLQQMEEIHDRVVRDAEKILTESQSPKMTIIKGGRCDTTPPNTFDLRSLNLHLVNSM